MPRIADGKAASGGETTVEMLQEHPRLRRDTGASEKCCHLLLTIPSILGLVWTRMKGGGNRIRLNSAQCYKMTSNGTIILHKFKVHIMKLKGKNKEKHVFNKTKLMLK